MANASYVIGLQSFQRVYRWTGKIYRESPAEVTSLYAANTKPYNKIFKDYPVTVEL